jgi:hypothetical protein
VTALVTSIHHICCHFRFSHSFTMASKQNSHLQWGFMAFFQGCLLLFSSGTKTVHCCHIIKSDRCTWVSWKTWNIGSNFQVWLCSMSADKGTTQNNYCCYYYYYYYYYYYTTITTTQLTWESFPSYTKRLQCLCSNYDTATVYCWNKLHPERYLVEISGYLKVKSCLAHVANTYLWKGTTRSKVRCEWLMDLSGEYRKLVHYKWSEHVNYRWRCG